MSDFTTLLLTAMGSSGQRKLAEDHLQELCFKDTGLFFTNLMKELLNESADVGLRQFAGTLIKNSTRIITDPKHNANKDFLWNSLELSLRENIKQSLLQLMVCKQTSIQKTCANAISTIFTVEIVNNSWTNLIDDLTASTQSTVAIDIRKAAVITLGQICDKLKEFKLGKQLNERTKENILMAILIGLQHIEVDIEICENSMIALGDCVEFMDTILSRSEVRDYATGLLIAALTHSNERIQLIALQRSCDYVKAIYPFLSTYVQALLGATKKAISSEDIEICLPAIEIWTTIAVEFRERSTINSQLASRVGSNSATELSNPNNLALVADELVKLLLQNLLRNEKDTEEAESDVQDSSQKALAGLVFCVGDSILETIKAFITNTLPDERWNYKQAAILAFSSLVESVEESQILPMIQAVFMQFIQLLNQSSKKVQDSVARLLARIAEFYPSSILLSSQSVQEQQELLQSLIAAMRKQPGISFQICWTFVHLLEYVGENYADAALTQYVDDLIQAFIQNANRTDISSSNYNLISTSYLAVLHSVKLITNPQTLVKHLGGFVSQFKNSYSTLAERRAPLQSGILSSIHACLATLNENFDKNFGEDMFGVIVDYFQFIKDVDTDGMYIVNQLAQCLEGAFAGLFARAWPYVEHVLTNKRQDSELFNTTIQTIGTFAQSCPQELSCKLEIVFPLLVNEFTQNSSILSSSGSDIKLKTSVIGCLADIFLYFEDAGLPFLQQTLALFDLSFNALVELIQTNSHDLYELAEPFKEKLIEAYTCIVHGFNKNAVQPNITIFNHFSNIMKFITITCDQNLHPTIEYVRNSLVLMLDAASFYGSAIASLVKTQFTFDLIAILTQKDLSEEGVETIEYANMTLQSI